MLEYKEYIYAVYRNRSFSRAAEELHVSQPWLSAAIKKTEQELQLKLFDRTTTPVSLTEAGRYYIEQIEQIMKTLDEKEEQLATPRMGTPAPAEHSAARTEEPGEALRTSLCEIDRKLETLRDLIENRDEENRHLWTLLDKMMDLVD